MKAKLGMSESAKNSGPNRVAISAACNERGIVLASHDDATSGHGKPIQRDNARIGLAHVLEAEERGGCRDGCIGIVHHDFPTIA